VISSPDSNGKFEGSSGLRFDKGLILMKLGFGCSTCL